MSSLTRYTAIALVVLIVSPVTAPLSSCTLADILSIGAPLRVAAAPTPSRAQVLAHVTVKGIPGDESRRIKDDSSLRQALPAVNGHGTLPPALTGLTISLVERTQVSPLVLRI